MTEKRERSGGGNHEHDPETLLKKYSLNPSTINLIEFSRVRHLAPMPT